MPAQLLRPAASNHAFFTHDARVAACGMLLGERAVERSEERLNDYKKMLSTLKISNQDLLELIYQLLPIIIKNNNQKNKDSIMKSKELIMKASKVGFTVFSTN